MEKIVGVVLLILLAGGCVKTEILKGPEKIKTITVWDSDLRLHYDRLTDDREGRDRVQGEGYQEEIEKSVEGKETTVGELPQVDLSLIEEGIARDLRDKQLLDERESKRIVEAGELEGEREQEGRGAAGLKWLIALAGGAFLGGSFTSIKKRERRQ